MKSILLILSLAALMVPTTMLTSCTNSIAEDRIPAALDPVAALQEQVEAERQLRLTAEAAVMEEALLRRRWELAALAASIIAVAGFLAGTALGSRGKRHAPDAA